ncbi:MAG: helix-turn-helix domain-containing protein [Deltaproteobacteria bacterium]|nr:helix-turn-helix domain-containing protein [Deltaproteobacteria bacterium]
MAETTFTHKDISRKTGVSETTIKSYRRKFPGCFPVASQGKPIRFAPEAAAVALRIRDLFASGMSVEEISLRLEDDFEWFSREKGSSEDRKDSERNGLRSELNRNVAAALGSMTKSLVSLHQQQKSILEYMKRLEYMLADLGLKGFDAEKAEYMRKENLSCEEFFSKIMQELLFLKSFFSISEKKQREPVFRQAEADPPEFPRRLLSLPLVMRNEEGVYLNAGGRSHGTLSINDLKALLLQNFPFPKNFTLAWEYEIEGWWVSFSQKDLPPSLEGESISLQVDEISSARGTKLLEVRLYRHNNSLRPVTELIGFITDFSGNQ